MSGTSLDGVDGVLAEFSSSGSLKVVSHAYRAFPEPLRNELLALNTSGPDELHRSALAASTLAGLYTCLLYTSPSPRDGLLSRMPSSA